ncbi:hypothetical protein PSAL_018150 [Pseudooceanicola algae]|uniref:Uncharacterized protein n=1 Tax=Pseudooceanicola algae TaxID=1537215 RepID=A0A418SLD4_9RHOB|nr:hypothetical protein PSAL_018150 [Pseudooceanicola algae]
MQPWMHSAFNLFQWECAAMVGQLCTLPGTHSPDTRKCRFMRSRNARFRQHALHAPAGQWMSCSSADLGRSAIAASTAGCLVERQVPVKFHCRKRCNPPQKQTVAQAGEHAVFDDLPGDGGRSEQKVSGRIKGRFMSHHRRCRRICLWFMPLKTSPPANIAHRGNPAFPQQDGETSRPENSTSEKQGCVHLPSSRAPSKRVHAEEDKQFAEYAPQPNQPAVFR